MQLSGTRKVEAAKRFKKRQFLENELEAYLRSLETKNSEMKTVDECFIQLTDSQFLHSEPMLVELLEPETPTNEEVF